MKSKKTFESKTFSLIIATVLVVATATIVLSIPEVRIRFGETEIDISPRRTDWTVMADNVPDPEAGTNSGICGFWVFETGSTYTAELTDQIAGYIDGGIGVNGTNLNNIPHEDEADSDFDLIVWVRFNATDAGGEVSNTKTNVTWAGNISSSTPPDAVHTWTADGFLHVNFVWNNGGSGFTLKRGQSVEIEDIIAQAFR
jgi:hypothetical protein